MYISIGTVRPLTPLVILVFHCINCHYMYISCFWNPPYLAICLFCRLIYRQGGMYMCMCSVSPKR